jgi:putative hydrolase of the HAD superfamily
MRAVLLDAFGTLVHLDAPEAALRRELRRRTGLNVSEAEAAVALRAEIAYYRSHHDEGRDPAGLAALRRRCAEVLRANLPAALDAPLDEVLAALLAALRFVAFPEVPGALRALRARGARLVVVSNWDVSLGAALDAAGLSPLLDGIVSSAEVGVRKPHVDIFTRALELAGAAPAQALHVGDSVSYDVAGARAAGIEPVLVVRGEAPAPSHVRTVRGLDELVVALPLRP